MYKEHDVLTALIFFQNISQTAVVNTRAMSIVLYINLNNPSAYVARVTKSH